MFCNNCLDIFFYVEIPTADVDFPLFWQLSFAAYKSNIFFLFFLINYYLINVNCEGYSLRLFQYNYHRSFLEGNLCEMEIVIL